MMRGPMGSHMGYPGAAMPMYMQRPGPGGSMQPMYPMPQMMVPSAQQPPERKLAFSVYFKPINYLRSTGIGAAIMGIALMMGMLVNPYAEALFGYLKGHPAYLVLGLVLVGFVMGLLKKK